MSSTENEPRPGAAPAVPSAAPADQHTAPPHAEASPAAPPPGDDDFDEYEPLTPELVEDEAIRGDTMLRWFVVLMAFVLASTRIGESATLVHVKTGQYLASHGFLPPANDVFSYTADDRPWTNLSWGFDLLVAGVHRLGSFVGLSLFKALVIGLAFWLIGTISRPGLPTWWGSICAATALLAGHLRFSAQPTIVTLLGTAIVLWLVHRWRQAGSAKRELWWLVPVFLVWCNLDPRAFLGLALLVLYGAGDALGALLQAQTAMSGASRKQFWLVTCACAAAMLVNPFGVSTLTSPLTIYGVEYPAVRDYVTGKYIGATPAALPRGASVVFFPLISDGVLASFDTAVAAGVLMMLAAAVLLFLNLARLDWGYLFVFAGFVALAFLCIHELAVTALVSCVVATLAGQSWYGATFRQTYSVDTAELLFSRGGRGLTVIAFAGILFFGGTGRLRDADKPRSGYGLDRSLAIALDDLENQLAGDRSFDHRPYNFSLSDGDRLIWAGEKVFADGRVTLYYDADRDKNHLARQQIARQALRQAPDRSKPSKTGGPGRARWRAIFERYQITHLVARLLPGSADDYKTLADLVEADSIWELTGLGPSYAVLYRIDRTSDPALQEFVAAHKVDFQDEAFRQKSEPVDVLRATPVAAPSFYQKYFWSRKRESSAEILRSQHLAQLAGMQLPARLSLARAAMAHLAIRLAQIGLEKEPQTIAGYLALGQAYQVLVQWEGLTTPGQQSPSARLRYVQAVAAFNQALTISPDNSTVHEALARLYESAQRVDLVLQHLEAIDDSDLEPSAQRVLADRIDELQKLVASIDENLEKRLSELGEANVTALHRAQYYDAQGCVLRALQVLDEQTTKISSTLAMSGDPAAEELRVRLMLEAGRVNEAFEAGQALAEPASRAGLTAWRHVVALANLPQGGYSEAIRLWGESADELDKSTLARALVSLPPRAGSNPPWPVSTLETALEYFYQRPEGIAGSRLYQALVLLEVGNNTAAEQYLRSVLVANPESPARPLVALYLNELTGKDDVDVFPPSERIPPLFAPEPGDEEEAEE